MERTEFYILKNYSSSRGWTRAVMKNGKDDDET